MLNKLNINSGMQKFLVYAAFTLFIIAVYWQVNRYDFISLDDYVYVAENNHIQSGITCEGLRWAFSTTHAEFWHPLTWLSLMFDYQLYGMKAGGYHLTNLILHILSTLLLFWLFCRMTGTVWRSAFVAAFFALHPLHVESVAWVAERKDVLSAFFWMLTLCFYVRYTEKPDIKRYLYVLFSFALALMSKPMVVTLPVVMILLDYWPLNRFESKKDNPVLWQLKEKTPLFILSAVFSFIALYAHYVPYRNNVPLNIRLANAPVSFVTYLEKTLWPYDLAVSYPFSNQFPAWEVLCLIILILFATIFIMMKAKRVPYIFTGWFWYTLTMLPVIGMIQVGSFAMADRYHYIPSIGIAFGLAWGIPALFQHENIHKKILFPVAIACLIILSVLTWKQCGYWSSGIKLFSHTLRVTKNNALAHNCIASSFAKEGQANLSFYHFNEAIRIKPDYADAYNNRGNAYMRSDKYGKAIEDYSKAIRLNPHYGDAYYNRGLAYFIHDEYKLGCVDAKKACELGVCELLKTAEGGGLCR